MIWVDDGFATLATARSTQGVNEWTDNGRTAGQSKLRRKSTVR